MSVLCYCYSRNVPAHKQAILKWRGNRFSSSQTQWYVDKPGAKTPGFKQMLKDISHDKPKTVVVYSLDQLYTSLDDGLEFLTNLLRNNGRIVAIEPQVDIAGPAAADLLVAVSKLGLEDWRTRQAGGIQEAKQRGVYKGRKKGAIKPGIDLQYVKEMRDRGFTQEAIAKELGVSRSTAAKYLRLALD